MFIIVLFMYLILFPLLIINGILQWFKDNISIIYILLVIISIPIKVPLAFMYLILYSILESLNYSKINELENPEVLMKF
ncbi:hypothetical protein OA86_15100 [Kaistella jeonii]|uniref:Uncharacterized protein n=1 Tax=Kaistella jeonii TaxID=266749 RepID=A0A0C1EMH5_9FLAO|nr:hypothetical protein OA86_15100 [Kaistella jeonii]